ncbi:MAG: kdkA [Gemmatimonadetes bacterium]|nr:kdkA [Gemmatimonadota bacterium]
MHWQRYLQDPALSAFVPVEQGAARMLLRRGLEPSAPALGLAGDPPSAHRVHGGRATHPVVCLPDASRAVVRRYHRGGAIRHVNRWTYFLGHRAFHELLATERARKAGVRAPEVLAATEATGGVGYTAWLATRMIDGAVESAAWLASAAVDERLGMLREAGRQVGRMHAAGIAHPDLNLRNLLVVDGSTAEGRSTEVRSVDARSPADRASEGRSASGSTEGRSTEIGSDRPSAVGIAELHPSNDTPSKPDASADSADDGCAPLVYLIDFDGARLFDTGVPERRRGSDLRRLARSARKLGAAIGAEGWAAMRDGYGVGDWPLSEDETRGLG